MLLTKVYLNMGPDDRHNDMLHKLYLLRAEHQLFLKGYAKNEIFELLEARFKNPPIRGYFSTLISRYIVENCIKNQNATRELFTTIIPFIAEVVITIQYYHNQVLDLKSGKTTSEEVQKNIQAATTLKSLLYEYIQEKKSLEEHERALINEYVSRMYYFVDIGQFIEKTANTIDAYKENKQLNITNAVERLLRTEKEISWPVSDKSIRTTAFKKQLLAENINSQGKIGYLPISKTLISEAKVLAQTMTVSAVIDNTLSAFPGKEVFVDLYFKKISLTCGALFSLTTQLIMKLMDLSETSKEGRALLAFARRFGVMRQIVNDCCDWAPASFELSTKAKTAQDAMSDLKNRNITLPLLFHLKVSTEESSIRNFLKSNSVHPDERLMFEEIIASNGLKMAMDTGHELAKEAISFLPHSSRKKTAVWYLKDMAKIANNNKYYSKFYCAINQSKGPQILDKQLTNDKKQQQCLL